MVEVELFAMGCGISFITLAGVYAYMRERFLEGTRRALVLERKEKARAKLQRAREASGSR